ncbi:P-loop NTPase, partial [Brenneria sp. 4F2]|nr:P-loop NTPase [Brenneria bubanii]
SGFICPYCAECTNIFSSGGGKCLAKSYSIPYLGSIPIDPKFVELIEGQSTSGEFLLDSYHKLALFSVFEKILLKLLDNQGP